MATSDWLFAEDSVISFSRTPEPGEAIIYYGWDQDEAIAGFTALEIGASDGDILAAKIAGESESNSYDTGNFRAVGVLIPGNYSSVEEAFPNTALNPYSGSTTTANTMQETLPDVTQGRPVLAFLSSQANCSPYTPDPSDYTQQANDANRAVGWVRDSAPGGDESVTITADVDWDSRAGLALVEVAESPDATPGIPATTLENADGTLSLGTAITRTITRVSDNEELFTGSQTSDSDTGELPEIDLSETAAEVDDVVDDRVTIDSPSTPGVVSTTVRRTVGDLA